MWYTVEQLAKSAPEYIPPQQQVHVSTFEMAGESNAMLQINFGVPGPGSPQPLSMVWIKAGAMVAYTGSVLFEHESMLSHGIGHALRKSISKEGGSLSKAMGKGRAQLYLVKQGKIVTILRLHGESITVSGNDLLVFESTLHHRIVAAIATGGLCNVRLFGYGFVAVLTNGKPICLTVSPGMPPVFTNPDATVAWTGDLSPEFVLVQPSEEKDNEPGVLRSCVKQAVSAAGVVAITLYYSFIHTHSTQ